MKPPRTDVLEVAIHLGRGPRDFLEAVRGEHELDPVRGEKRGGLLRERVLGLGDDAEKVSVGEGVEGHADRETALQLRNEVRGLGHVKGARGDEKDVVRLHHPVFRLHGRPFHERQEVALHAFARDVGASPRPLLAGDLVDLVEEDDARLLRAPDGLFGHGGLVGERVALARHEERTRVGHRKPHFPLFRRAEQVRKHSRQVKPHLFHALRSHHGNLRRPLVRHLELDLARLVLAVLEVPTHLVAPVLQARTPSRIGTACRSGGERNDEQIHEPLFGGLGRTVGHARAALVLHEADGRLDEVAGDRVDVAPDVAHFRELRRLDFHERRVHEAREPPRDFRLADARGADHEDVLRHRVALKLGGEALAPPPVAERDRHRALGLRLAHHVPVELGHDLPRREVFEEMGCHGSVSTRIASFV